MHKNKNNFLSVEYDPKYKIVLSRHNFEKFAIKFARKIIYCKNRIMIDMKTQQIINNALKRSRLGFRANVSYVNLHTFLKFNKLRAE